MPYESEPAVWAVVCESAFLLILGTREGPCGMNNTMCGSLGVVVDG